MEENKNMTEEINTEEGLENNKDESIPAVVADLTKDETAPVQDEATASEEAPVKEEINLEKPDDVAGDYNGNDIQKDNAFFYPIRYVADPLVNIDDDVEKSRAIFASKVSKSRIIDIISIILMAVSFGGVITVTLLNRGNAETQWVNWLVVGIALAIIIFSFILTSIFNKKNSRITKEYLNEYEDMICGYAISDLEVEGPTLCVDSTINNQDIIQAHYFKTISRIESRAVVEGTRYGHSFTMAEVSVIIPPVSFAQANKKPEDYVNLDGSIFVPDPITDTMTGTQEIGASDMTLVDVELSDELLSDKERQKKEKEIQKANLSKQTDTQNGIFGKYVSYGLTLDSDEAFILVYMGESEFTVLPDFLTGFKAVKVPGLRNDIVLYAVDPTKVAKFFDADGVAIVNNFTPNTVVQSMFISMNSYGTHIGMNLSDDIMRLPVKSIAHTGSFTTYKEANDHAFNFIDFVAKQAGK